MAAALFIRNVTLIDGSGAPPLAGAAIAIDGDRISAAGPTAAVAPPPGAEVIDGSGLFATPGMVDAHIHLQLVGRESLPLFLANGVTTVRDLGSELGFLVETRRMLHNGADGPRLLFTGPMIDGELATWPGLVRATPDGDAAVRVVQEYLDAGADAIKLYTTLPPDSLRRCIDHVGGRVPVTGHLGATRASEAIAAGINGLEHALLTPYNDFAPDGMRTAPDEVMLLPGFWSKVVEGWLRADLRSDGAQRWVELLVQRDVSFCPTLTVLPMAGDEPNPDELQYAPAVVQERSTEAAALRGQVPAEVREKGRRAREVLQQLVGLVHRAGGRIISGTDLGAIRGLVPGFALHKELGLLAGSGMSNMDVLRAATARAAEALWRDDLGVIAPGKRADVLLVRRNPLEDIGALRDIHRVVAGGRVFDPAALLAQAKA